MASVYDFPGADIPGPGADIPGPAAAGDRRQPSLGFSRITTKAQDYAMIP
jgi:hypothetical protein